MSPPLFTRAAPPSHRSWHPSACHPGISWPALSSHRSHSEPGPGLCQGLNPLNMTIVGSKNRHQDVLTRASEHWEKCEMKWARYFLINKKGNLSNMLINYHKEILRDYFEWRTTISILRQRSCMWADPFYFSSISPHTILTAITNQSWHDGVVGSAD